MKRIAISQSNYVPWLGYFRTIASVDLFVLYDEVQFTRRDWRNRNRIWRGDAPHWISIPVRSKGRFDQRIDETEIVDSGWARSHWTTIEQSYRHAPRFDDVAEPLNAFYRSVDTSRLSEVNRMLIELVLDLLQIDVPLAWSTDFARGDSDRNGRLIEICQQAGATHYLSAPAAADYIDLERFADAGLVVEFVDYSKMPVYRVMNDCELPPLSVLDALFHRGADRTLVEK